MDGYWKIPLMKEIDHLKEEIKKAPHSQQVYNQCSYIRGYIYALNVTGMIDFLIIKNPGHIGAD